MQETEVWHLGLEDTLEEETATYSNIVTWKIPWTEKPGRLQSMRLQGVRYKLLTEHIHKSLIFSFAMPYQLLIPVSVYFIIGITALISESSILGF